MIERHQDLSYYRGCRDALLHIHEPYRDIVMGDVIKAEAEVMDAMAEAACICAAREGVCAVHGGVTRICNCRESFTGKPKAHSEPCPVHGGATK